MSTGFLTVDAALGGGVPRGGVIEVAGDEGTGKTTFALHLARQACAAGGWVLYLDYEHACFADYMARVSGMPVMELGEALQKKPERCIVWVVPDSLEDGDAVLTVMLDEIPKSLRMVVCDSFASMTPDATMKNDLGESRVGLQAQMLTEFLARVSKRLAKLGVIMYLANQLRADLTAQRKFGPPPLKSAGPRALGYYCWQRMRLFSGKIPSWEGVWPKTHCTYFAVKKNKTSRDRIGRTRLVIEPGQGFSAAAELLDLAVQERVLHSTDGGLKWRGRGPWIKARFIEKLADPQVGPQAMSELKADLLKATEGRTLALDLSQKTAP